MIGELWIQTCIATTLRYVVLCVLTLVTQKLYRLYAKVLHIEWQLYYWRCLFSVLELDARYKWWVTHPNMQHSLFQMSNFCIYSVLRQLVWKLHVTRGRSAYRTTALLLETFSEWFQSCNRDLTRELQRETHIGHSLIWHCVCTTSPYIHCDWIGNHTWKQNSWHYDCLLHNKRWFYCPRCIVL